MKKNLLILTGIVFLIAVLVAGGCSTGKKQKDNSNEEGAAQKAVAADSTKVDIFLKAIEIGGSMHLEMYDSKKPDCEVTDDHLIVVKRRYTVNWKNAAGSKIDEIKHIRPVADSTFFGAVPEVGTREADGTVVDTAEFFSVNGGILTLVIPDTACLDTLIKYEIVFTLKKDPNIYTIDPYLKIPKGL